MGKPISSKAVVSNLMKQIMLRKKEMNFAAPTRKHDHNSSSSCSSESESESSESEDQDSDNYYAAVPVTPS